MGIFISYSSKEYEEAYKRIKSGTDEEEPNVSGYILIGIIAVVVAGVSAYIVYLNKKEKGLNK